MIISDLEFKSRAEKIQGLIDSGSYQQAQLETDWLVAYGNMENPFRNNAVASLYGKIFKNSGIQERLKAGYNVLEFGEEGKIWKILDKLQNLALIQQLNIEREYGNLETSARETIVKQGIRRADELKDEKEDYSLVD